MDDNKNVAVVIKAEGYPVWMTRAAWYGAHKNLPDAKIIVLLDRLNPSLDMYRWVTKVGAKLLLSGSLEKFSDCEVEYVVPATTVAVRPYDKNNVGPSSSKTNDQTTFVDYSDGVGRFVIEQWIDRNDVPFSLTKRLATNDMTVNELAVLKLWERLNMIHHTL